MDPVSPSRLRANLYRILDRILATGEPVQIARNGRQLRLMPEGSSRLDALQPHPDYIQGNPEELVHMDWSGEWRP